MPECLLGLLCAWLVATNIFWLRRDLAPHGTDDAYYLKLALNYHDALARGVGTFGHALLHLDPLRPPLVPMLPVPLIGILGRSADATLTVYIAGFVVLALAAYGIGRRIAGRWCGLLAAALTCAYPSVIVYSRVFLLDFGTTVIVAVALYFLVRSDAFRNTPSTVAVGALFGAAVLSRTFAPIFFVGPVGVSAFAAWRAGRIDGSMLRRVRSASLAVLATVIAAGWWYFPNLSAVSRRSLSAAYGAESVGYGPRHPYHPAALAGFFIVFLNEHLTPVGLVVGAVAAWWLWTRIVRAKGHHSSLPRRHVVLLVSACALPYVFFMSLRAQNPKNITPALVAVGVLTAWGLVSIGKPRLRASVVALALASAALQFVTTTFGLPGAPNAVAVQPTRALPPLNLYSQGYKPRRDYWPIGEILLRIAQRQDERGVSRSLVGIVSDHPDINYSNFWYQATLHRLPLILTRIAPLNRPPTFYRSQLQAADFLITKDGYVGPAFLNKRARRITAEIRSSSAFRLVDQFRLPDGSTARIYERR